MPKSSSSTSAGPVTGMAPSRSRPFVPRRSRGHVPRHSGYRAAEIAGELRGDQAAARIGGLHDHGHLREPRHDPVACREAQRYGCGARRQLRQHQAPIANPVGEAAMTPRIDDVRTAARTATGCLRRQAAAMSRRVDPQRQPADNRDPGCRQPATQGVGHLPAVGAGTRGRRSRPSVSRRELRAPIDHRPQNRTPGGSSRSSSCSGKPAPWRQTAESPRRRAVHAGRARGRALERRATPPRAPAAAISSSSASASRPRRPRGRVEQAGRCPEQGGRSGKSARRQASPPARSPEDSCGDPLPIVEPIAERLLQIGRLNAIAPVKVGDRARHPQDAVVSPPLRCGWRAVSSRAVVPASMFYLPTREAAVHIAVAEDRRSLESLPLASRAAITRSTLHAGRPRAGRTNQL